MVLINLLNEISACFTNLRLILIYNKLEKSLLYLLNGFLILISFVMLRVILGGYVIYKMIIPNLIINIENVLINFEVKVLIHWFERYKYLILKYTWV